MPCFAAHKNPVEVSELAHKLAEGFKAPTMSCLDGLTKAQRESIRRTISQLEKIKAHVQATGDKKVALIIENVKVSEVKLIMEFIWDLRAKEKASL